MSTAFKISCFLTVGLAAFMIVNPILVSSTTIDGAGIAPQQTSSVPQKLETLQEYKAAIDSRAASVPASIQMSDSIADQVFEGINSFRSSNISCGNMAMPATVALERNDALDFVAKDHIIDMIENNFTGPISSNGFSLRQRIAISDRSGLYSFTTENQIKIPIPQNVSSDDALATVILDHWKNRPRDCSFLKHEDINFVGISAARSGGEIVGTVILTRREAELGTPIPLLTSPSQDIELTLKPGSNGSLVSSALDDGIGKALAAGGQQLTMPAAPVAAGIIMIELEKTGAANQIEDIELTGPMVQVGQ